MRTAYSINRGDRLSDQAFGHGGFTGTVLWIDPQLDLFFVFLSNRVHPNGKGLVNPLAGRIASVVASAITDADAALARVLNQLEQLCAQDDADQLIAGLLRKFNAVTGLSGWSDPSQLH